MSAEGASVLYEVAARGVARRKLRQFAQMLKTEVAGGRPFSCLITGDRQARRLNRQFRNRDYPADVLSFPNAAGIPASGVALGEIAISFDRAKQQAGDLGHNAEQELQILMLHGVLHLAGFDHERDSGQMARAERCWRKRFGLPAGLIERARP